MGKFTNQLQTRNQIFLDVDQSKIFVWDNKFVEGTLKNTTGGTLTFEKGTLLGRESNTGDLVILRSATGANGENIPVGILASEITLDNLATGDVAVCIFGEVVEDKIIFEGSDTFDTVVALHTLRDRISSDTMGIKPVPSASLSQPDNS